MLLSGHTYGLIIILNKYLLETSSRLFCNINLGIVNWVFCLRYAAYATLSNTSLGVFIESSSFLHYRSRLYMSTINACMRRSQADVDAFVNCVWRTLAYVITRHRKVDIIQVECSQIVSFTSPWRAYHPQTKSEYIRTHLSYPMRQSPSVTFTNIRDAFFTVSSLYESFSTVASRSIVALIKEMSWWLVS